MAKIIFVDGSFDKKIFVFSHAISIVKFTIFPSDRFDSKRV